MTRTGRPRKQDGPKRAANGQATCYAETRNGKTMYLVMGTVTGQEDRGRQKGRRAPTRPQAWDNWEEKLQEALQCRHVKNPTVAQITEEWLSNYELANVQASSKIKRVDRVRQHIVEDKLGELLAAEVRPGHVEQWVLGKMKTGYLKGGRRASYSGNYIGMLKSDLGRIFDWTIGRHRIPGMTVNPVDTADNFAIDDETASKRALTSDQLRRFVLELTETKRRYAAFALVGLFTGARPGEIHALRWADVDSEAETLRFEQALKRDRGGGAMALGPIKTIKRGSTNHHGERTVRVPSIVIEALMKERKLQDELRQAWWPSEWDGLVFLGSTGRPPNKRNMQREIQRLAADAGLDTEVANFQTYELRHTAASLLDAENISPSEVMEQFGWKDIRTYHKYYRHRTRPIAGEAAVAAWQNLLHG